MRRRRTYLRSGPTRSPASTSGRPRGAPSIRLRSAPVIATPLIITVPLSLTRSCPRFLGPWTSCPARNRRASSPIASGKYTSCASHNARSPSLRQTTGRSCLRLRAVNSSANRQNSPPWGSRSHRPISVAKVRGQRKSRRKGHVPHHNRNRMAKVTRKQGLPKAGRRGGFGQGGATPRVGLYTRSRPRRTNGRTLGRVVRPAYYVSRCSKRPAENVAYAPPLADRSGSEKGGAFSAFRGPQRVVPRRLLSPTRNVDRE
jgi:hypothetical protein